MCPAERGGPSRGLPTCSAAPFVSEAFAVSEDPPPVWPWPDGQARGVSFEPLYRSAPKAAGRDPALYRLLVLVDLLRGGGAREREWAAGELQRALGSE